MQYQHQQPLLPLVHFEQLEGAQPYPPLLLGMTGKIQYQLHSLLPNSHSPRLKTLYLLAASISY